MMLPYTWLALNVMTLKGKWCSSKVTNIDAKLHVKPHTRVMPFDYKGM